MDYKDTDLVIIKEIIPDIVTDIKYATKDNFTGKVIYENDDAYLRYGTLKKLRSAQEEVKKYGYSLIIWDAYRPKSAQFRLWEVCPDDDFVANPYKGASMHNRGCAVDVSLVDENGNLLEMPSMFDEFSLVADREYSDVSEEAAENSMLLEKVMTSAGFVAYPVEWWHYNDSDEYDVVEE